MWRVRSKTLRALPSSPLCCTCLALTCNCTADLRTTFLTFSKAALTLSAQAQREPTQENDRVSLEHGSEIIAPSHEDVAVKKQRSAITPESDVREAVGAVFLLDWSGRCFCAFAFMARLCRESEQPRHGFICNLALRTAEATSWSGNSRGMRSGPGQCRSQPHPKILVAAPRRHGPPTCAEALPDIGVACRRGLEAWLAGVATGSGV